MVSKALVVGMYQRKLEEMAALPDVELTVAVPPYWREKTGHDLKLERSFTKGYALTVLPMRFNGHYHVHYYPGLGGLLDSVRPDILHFDEEAYNLSTWLAMHAAKRRGVRFAFFNWQNIPRRYPPPFRWLERDVFRHADLAIVGNEDAGTIIRDKGYEGLLEIIPQFGIDPELFAPKPDTALPRAFASAGALPVRCSVPMADSTTSREGPPTSTEPAPLAASLDELPGHEAPFTIGFVGRLIQAKGLGVLMEAAAGLEAPWQLRVIGSGPERESLEQLAHALGIETRVEFVGQIGSTSMPAIMQSIDVLVGPSLTTSRWKEQFGRMLIEAMASEVPVIGSDSGEIPHVIGDAGLVVPEGSMEALRTALQRLQANSALRCDLGRAGRQRVLEHFTQQAVAVRTVDAYRRVLAS
jgi:glycosyltransferase involved in cell wall biosynthesis